MTEIILGSKAVTKGKDLEVADAHADAAQIGKYFIAQMEMVAGRMHPTGASKFVVSLDDNKDFAITVTHIKRALREQ